MLRTDVRGRYRTTRRFPADRRLISPRRPRPAGSPPARRPSPPASRAGRVLPIVLRRLRDDRRPGRRPPGPARRRCARLPVGRRADAHRGHLRRRPGRFRLPGFLEGPALVFAEKDGFRLGFAGCDGRQATRAARPDSRAHPRRRGPGRRLHDATARPCRSRRRRPWPVRLIRPAGRAGPRSRRTIGRNTSSSSDWPQFDPDDALERLETAQLADPDDVGSIRIAAAEALAGENLDEATGHRRGHRHRRRPRPGLSQAVCEPCPTWSRRGRRPLLDQAIVNTRAATSPVHEALPALADRRAADRARRGRAGRALIREGRELAGQPAGGRHVAWRLADFAGVLLPARSCRPGCRHSRTSGGSSPQGRRGDRARLRLRSAPTVRPPTTSRPAIPPRPRRSLRPHLVHPGRTGESVRRRRLRAGWRRSTCPAPASSLDLITDGRAGPQALRPGPDGRGDRRDRPGRRASG